MLLLVAFKMELLKQLASYSCEYEDKTGCSLHFGFYYIEGDDNPSISWVEQDQFNTVINCGFLESLSEEEQVLNLLKSQVEG